MTAIELPQLSLVVLVGWSSARTNAPARANASIKVGLIVKTNTNPYFVDMIKGAKAQAKKLGVQLIVASGKLVA